MKALVLAALRSLSRLWPPAGLLAAQALTVLTRPLRFGISDEWLATVFPELTPAERRDAQRRTWEGFLKGEALDAGVKRTRGRYRAPRVVRNPQLDRLQPPFIAASIHIGPFQALASALEGKPRETVVITRGQFDSRHKVTLLHAGEDEWSRARTFHRTLSTLRAGNVVLVTADGFDPEHFDVATIEVPLLGRSWRLARGAFALARIAEVPIVPVVLRWEGTRMLATFGEPIAPALPEAGMAAELAAWFERYLRERPGEISVFVLEQLTPPLPR